jgi:alpha-galactosidase
MTRQKIVLIGAGSAMFTQGLVADLILTGQPWRLGLVDIDPHALAVAEGLSRRMVAARDADVIVEGSLDRRDLLTGADVVVTTIGVGSRRAWEADVFIPRQHGIFQPVGDTVMAGGISRALRMIPAMIAIAADVIRLCPQARFVNYGNPMTANCWAIRKATGADVLGLCHGVFHVQRELAEFIGAAPEEVTCQGVGLNHFTWIYDLRWRGADAWPLVREKLAAEARGEPTGKRRAADNPFSWALFAAYGAYPAVNDRHVTEFFPERFPGGAYYGKTLGVDAFSFERTIAHGDEIYERMAAQAAGEIPLNDAIFRRAAGEHEQLLDILDSIASDKRVTYSANLPNRGAVPALPSDAILELTCAATARGLQPLLVPDFPPTLAAPLIRKIAAVELTVEAALRGSRPLFVEALLADGCVNDSAIAGRLADDLLAAQREHLPQFA